MALVGQSGGNNIQGTLQFGGGNGATTNQAATEFGATNNSTTLRLGNHALTTQNTTGSKGGSFFGIDGLGGTNSALTAQFGKGNTSITGQDSTGKAGVGLSPVFSTALYGVDNNAATLQVGGGNMSTTSQSGNRPVVLSSVSDDSFVAQLAGNGTDRWSAQRG